MFRKKSKIVISFVLCFAILITANHFAYGEDSKEKQKKIIDMQRQNDDLQYKADSAEKELDKLNKKLDKMGESLIETAEKLKLKKKEIKKNKRKLNRAQQQEQQQYADMKLRIQYMYENGDMQMIDLIFNSSSINDMLSKAEYISDISTYDRKMFQKLSDTRKKIEVIGARLNADKKKLVALKNKQKKSIAKMKTLSEKKEAEIKLYKDQIAQNHVDEDALMKELRDLIRKEQEERKANGEEDVMTTPHAWPLPGHTYLSSNWGDRAGRKSPHKGIDIPAPIGTPIVASGAGTVIWAYNSSSAGMFVGISHGGGVVTEYMHMMAFVVAPGDKVSAGQTIGYVGLTGQTTGPHLHFGVKMNGVNVNPHIYVG
ncbi:MAG: peptidoglycan DD-metalloendopeptidase family protein [Eubacterium sp.]|nr:peptidoglycan DD-metalloendopeptidase family protein [Eubacterium sp.]